MEGMTQNIVKGTRLLEGYVGKRDWDYERCMEIYKDENIRFKTCRKKGPN